MREFIGNRGWVGWGCHLGELLGMLGGVGGALGGLMFGEVGRHTLDITTRFHPWKDSVVRVLPVYVLPQRRSLADGADGDLSCSVESGWCRGGCCWADTGRAIFELNGLPAGRGERSCVVCERPVRHVDVAAGLEFSVVEYQDQGYEEDGDGDDDYRDLGGG